MKTIKYIALVAIAASMALVSTSCANNEAPDNESCLTEKLTLNISARTSDNNEDTWDNGDKIKISASNGGEIATMGYNGTSWLTTDGHGYLAINLPFTFNACFPSTTSPTEFTIPLAQQDASAFHAADFMTSDAITLSAVPANGVDIVMKHRLCRVKFVITEFTDGFTPNELKDEKIVSQFPTVSVSYSGSSTTVTAKGNSSVEIDPMVTRTTNMLNTYTALVAPATLDTGTKMMSIMVDGIMRNVIYTGDTRTMESGKSYSFNMTIKDFKITVSNCTIADFPGWNNETDIQ